MSLVRRLPTLLFLAAVACQSRVEGVEAVVVRGPTSEARLDQALPRAPTARLSLAASELLKGANGPVAVDAPSAIQGAPPEVKLTPLLADDAARKALLALDEGAAAKAIVGTGAHTLVLHRAVATSLDRDRTVLSRLYQHDQLSQFSLARVTDDLLIYKVLDVPLAFPPQLAALAVRYLRHRLGGGAPAQLPDVRSEAGKWTLMAELREASGGREQAVAFAQSASFQGALEELAVDLEREHRRDVELWGFPPLARGIDGLSIEVLRVVERAEVEPRGEADLEDLWELGVDGAFVMTKDKGERGFLPGGAAYTRAITSADAFLRATADQGGMSERRPWRDPDAMLELLRTIHYRENARHEIVGLYRGVPVVTMGDVTLDRVRAAILAAGDWYLRNLQPDGRVTYKVWPSENRYSNEYNHVRHTLATWNLTQAWTLDPKPAYLDGAKKALEWTNLARKDTGEVTAYEYAGTRKLGSAVVGLLGIIDLAQATGDHQWDDLMKRLGRFAMGMQLPSGTFNGYDVGPDNPYYNQQNDIVPGEAALALVRLAEYTDDNSWIAGLPRFWSYYEPWFRERAAKKDPDRPWPAMQYDDATRLELVQFGPWTVMAANAYNRRTGDAAVGQFGLEVARWMIQAYEWDQSRAPFPDYIGGYYKMPRELPAMQAFCYGEGTAAAYQLALRVAPDQAPWFEQMTRETVRFALNMQYGDESLYPFTRGDEVRGGIRYALNETKVRIDYVYHAQSAMYQWYQAALNDPKLPAEVRGAALATPAVTVPADVPEPAAPAASRGLEQQKTVPDEDKDPEGGD